MKNFKVETSFVVLKGPKARSSKTGIIFMNFYFNVRRKLSVIPCCN